MTRRWSIAPPGRRLVMTVDAMVEGVHYLPDDPPDLVAKKLLRVNLSDLAAKGARPLHYLLTTALPATFGDDWVERFAAGLAEDQRRFGVDLLGGDSVATPGPAALSLTAIGEVACRGRNSPQRRAARRPGLGQRHDWRRLSRAEGVARRVSAARPGPSAPAGRALSAAGAAHRARAAPRRRRACHVRRVGRADRRSRPYLRGIEVGAAIVDWPPCRCPRRRRVWRSRSPTCRRGSRPAATITSCCLPRRRRRPPRSSASRPS